LIVPRIIPPTPTPSIPATVSETKLTEEELGYAIEEKPLSLGISTEFALQLGYKNLVSASRVGFSDDFNVTQAIWRTSDGAEIIVALISNETFSRSYLVEYGPGLVTDEGMVAIFDPYGGIRGNGTFIEVFRITNVSYAYSDAIIDIESVAKCVGETYVRGLVVEAIIGDVPWLGSLIEFSGLLSYFIELRTLYTKATYTLKIVEHKMMGDDEWLSIANKLEAKDFSDMLANRIVDLLTIPAPSDPVGAAQSLHDYISILKEYEINIFDP